MKPVAPALGLLTLITLSSNPAAADKLGEHPAIVARRVIAAQGYDYASKFYPHPAWLYLRPQSLPLDDVAATGRKPAQDATAAVRTISSSELRLEPAQAARP